MNGHKDRDGPNVVLLVAPVQERKHEFVFHKMDQSILMKRNVELMKDHRLRSHVIREYHVMVKLLIL